MSAPFRWTFRTLAAASVLATVAQAAPAQVVQPTIGRTTPLDKPTPVPGTNGKSFLMMSSVTTLPGIPADRLFAPMHRNPRFVIPANNGPGVNPVVVRRGPVNPFAANRFFLNPRDANPLLLNPAVNAPFGLPGYRPGFAHTPPVAVRLSGATLYKSQDWQANPASGTVYQPVSGRVTLADGSTFFPVPESGLPIATGDYATGTELDFNPQAGTFFSPASGILSMPGGANAFLPYVW